MPRSPLDWVLSALHVLWAGVGIYASVLLLRAGGHPPGLVFLPVALVAWALGHLFLWGAGRLARAGARRLAARGVARHWPVPVVLATLGTGAVTVLGLAGLGGMALQRELRLDLWTGSLFLAWLPHAVCFPALLLRLGWARVVAACLAFGWIAILVYQFLTTTAPRPGEVALAAALAAGLLALGVALWRPGAAGG